MSYSRRSFIVASLLALAGCGFSPVYAPGGAGDGLREAIFLAEPDNRNEFSFVSQMEQRLGRAENARYSMAYKITTRSEGVGITPEQETTRKNVFGTVEYSVTEIGSKTVLHSGSVDNFTGYSTTSLIVGTQSSTRDANKRLMVLLADQVVARLIATSKDWRQ